jgi:RimJ/RimL family protein N-acetyltransferase
VIVVGPEVAAWVRERVRGYVEPWASGIGWTRDGELIAGVCYDSYNGRSICMHVASERKHWLSRGFLAAVFGYPFQQLGVTKILGLVDSTNLKARRFDEHLGFVLEARITDAVPDGDLLIYSMRRDQCRYLRD